MNLLHRWICRSTFWGNVVRQRIVPWTLEDLDLGCDVLELGAGPGAATECLVVRAGRLTCLEIDDAAAGRLHRRMKMHDVQVLCADAVAAPFPDRSFDAVVCFSMLHHLPSSALQDRLFGEAARLLRPAGVFAGFDIRDTMAARLVHAFDTMVPIQPGGLPRRLLRAGFVDADMTMGAGGFRFRARRA